jgi:hypothetical protein
LIPEISKKVQHMNKAGRAEWAASGFAARGVRLSGGLSPSKIEETAASTRSLSGPVKDWRVEEANAVVRGFD